jgi:hypothetical protein
MGHSKVASYQSDTLAELARQADVHCYGPGFPDYSQSDTLCDVVSKSPFKPDVLIFGHSWLADGDGAKVDRHTKLWEGRDSWLKVGILNKEYTNLDAKLKFYRENKFNLIFSHHHEAPKYGKIIGCKVVFWPFAFDHKKCFWRGNEERQHDIMFSGVLRNENVSSNQSDIRIRVMRRLFHTAGSIPIQIKKRYQSMSVFWNAKPWSEEKRLYRFCSMVFPKYRYRYISFENYALLLRQSKSVLNSLSPQGLVSPRFFESMASGALVLTDEDSLQNTVIPQNLLVTFKTDMSDFDKVLSEIQHGSDQMCEIRKMASAYCIQNHTWEIRISSMLSEINRCARGLGRKLTEP